MNEKTIGGETHMAGKTLIEMIEEARGYVELFLEDLQNEETIIEEPQEMLHQILVTMEYAGWVVAVISDL